MEKREPRAVSGMKFMMALEAAGVLQKADHTRRVVIDCVFNEPLMVYVENVGDERILEVVTHPDLKVAIVEREAEDMAVANPPRMGEPPARVPYLAPKDGDAWTCAYCGRENEGGRMTCAGCQAGRIRRLRQRPAAIPTDRIGR